VDDLDEGDAHADESVLGLVVGGRYRVVRKLGQGGMGAVYVAHQEALRRDVALKLVRGELACVPRHVERFRREAKTLSQLSHPNIVALYDFGEEQDSNTLWFVMELLRGQSLRDRLRARGALPVVEGIAIVRQMCTALAVAHERGVLHRDLKPDNVMLVESDFVKLVDFGIAKAVGDAHDGGVSLTQTGTVVGTPGYVPREISVDGIHDDVRSDLYSVGVTWFEMLAGEPPFMAQTAVGLMMKHASEPAPRVMDVAPHVPPRISSLVDRLLSKNPDDRPASAHALLALLDDLERTPAHAEKRTDSFASLRASAAPVLVTSPFLDVPHASIDVALASAETVAARRLRDETPASTPNLPAALTIEPVASVRLRTLLVIGAVVCGLVVAGVLALTLDDDVREAPPKPAAPIVKAAPIVEAAPIVKPAPAVTKPKRTVTPPVITPTVTPGVKLLDDDKPKLID
jgi:serine/threonine protein kinase